MTTKSLVNGAMMIAIYLVFLSLYTIGIFPSIAALMLPIPIIVFSLKSKKFSEIIILFIGCALGSAIIASIFGLLTTAVYGLSGVLIGWGYVKKWPYWQRILNSGIVYMIGFPIIIHILSGMWVSEALLSVFNESFSLITNQMPEVSEQAELLQDMMNTRLPQMIPTLLLLSGMGISFVTDLIAQIILKRLRIEVPRFGNIRNLQLGSRLAMLYVLSQFAFILFTQPEIQFVLINLVLLLNVLFIVQGIVVLFSFFGSRRKGISIMITIFLILTNTTLVLSMLGVMDAMFDYRRRFKKREL